MFVGTLGIGAGTVTMTASVMNIDVVGMMAVGAGDNTVRLVTALVNGSRINPMAASVRPKSVHTGKMKMSSVSAC